MLRQYGQGVQIGLDRLSDLEQEADLVRDFGIYGDSAVAYQTTGGGSVPALARLGVPDNRRFGIDGNSQDERGEIGICRRNHFQGGHATGSPLVVRTWISWIPRKSGFRYSHTTCLS